MVILTFLKEVFPDCGKRTFPSGSIMRYPKPAIVAGFTSDIRLVSIATTFAFRSLLGFAFFRDYYVERACISRSDRFQPKLFTVYLSVIPSLIFLK